MFPIYNKVVFIFIITFVGCLKIVSICINKKLMIEFPNRFMYIHI